MFPHLSRFSASALPLLLCATAGTATTLASTAPLPGSDIQTPVGYTLLKTAPHGSKLYRTDAPSAVYEDAPMVFNALAPSHFLSGYDYASVLGEQALENYNALLTSLLGEDSIVSEKLKALLERFLDWQWEYYLSVEVPAEYMDEFRGMSAGSKDASFDYDVGVLSTRGVVLTNFPGYIVNLQRVIQDELAHPARGRGGEGGGVDSDSAFPLTESEADELFPILARNWKGLTCSMYGVWGTRTEGGKLYTGRNLDWLKDSDISRNKLITIHHPEKSGGYAHATIGWAGVWGAITGISSQGLTVHEANLESVEPTFRGFPWIVRLRHVMANAANIEEAVSLWLETNNTCGFNHAFGSAKDNEAVCLETMQGKTAVFRSNDPREQPVYADDGTQIAGGQPREEAIYRTNHPYDPYEIENFDSQFDSSYSHTRYNLFPEMLDAYSTQGTVIGAAQAVNMSSIVGDKGAQHLYDCEDSSDASNILSVAYEPAGRIAYIAWENKITTQERKTFTTTATRAGEEEEENAWLPAACNTYLKIDFNEWFTL